MKNIFEDPKLIFAILILVPTVPSIILVIHKGDYEPFDIIVIVTTAVLAFAALFLLAHWVRKLIRYMSPDRSEKPHIGYPYHDKPKSSNQR